MYLRTHAIGHLFIHKHIILAGTGICEIWIANYLLQI